MIDGPTVSGDEETVASPEDLIRLSGELRHVLTLLDERVLPTMRRVSELMAKGRATPIDGVDDRAQGGGAGSRSQREIEKINIQCDLLSEAGVSNGCKSMSIFLHANWRGHLLERYGPHSPVDTLKRWRTLRSRSPHTVLP